MERYEVNWTYGIVQGQCQGQSILILPSACTVLYVTVYIKTAKDSQQRAQNQTFSPLQNEM